MQQIARFLKRGLTGSSDSKRIKRTSYAQCGEDLIMEFLTSLLGISAPTYLDIGAHDPMHLSNTYLFYERGCSGVCVEPDPFLFERIKSKRRRDVCLNVGVGLNSTSSADFYLMSWKAFNTFSKQDAENEQSRNPGNKIERVIQVPLKPINDILSENFKEAPDILSIDVEGLDFAILKSMDFSAHRPALVCVETLSPTSGIIEKNQEIIDYMQHKQEYYLYADTFVNSIFVEKHRWDKYKHTF